MSRCVAKTRAGPRCLNMATDGAEYCSRHSDQTSFGEFASTVGGALLGNALAPGLGGLVFGGFAGRFIRNIFKEQEMAKKRVFVSFDFDNDQTLKHFIVGQSRLADSPFEIVDFSLIEAAPERTWEDKARTAIKKSEIVLVIVGSKTHRAPGVLKEVKMARDAKIPIVQIIGYKDGDYTPVPDAGRLYKWSWDNLKKLLS